MGKQQREKKDLTLLERSSGRENIAERDHANKLQSLSAFMSTFNEAKKKIEKFFAVEYHKVLTPNDVYIDLCSAFAFFVTRIIDRQIFAEI